MSAHFLWEPVCLYYLKKRNSIFSGVCNCCLIFIVGMVCRWGLLECSGFECVSLPGGRRTLKYIHTLVRMVACATYSPCYFLYFSSFSLSLPPHFHPSQPPLVLSIRLPFSTSYLLRPPFHVVPIVPPPPTSSFQPWSSVHPPQFTPPLPHHLNPSFPGSSSYLHWYSVPI